MSDGATNLRHVRDWLVSQNEQGRIATGTRLIKIGEVEQGIAIIEASLPKLLNSTMRAVVVRQLIRAHLKLAGNFRRAKEPQKAAAAMVRAISVMESEITRGSMSAGRSIALLDAITQQLANNKRLKWAAQLRGAAPSIGKPMAVAAQKLEAIVEKSAAPPDGAEARGLVAELGKAEFPAVWWLAMHDRLYRRGLASAAIDAKRAAAHAVLTLPMDERRRATHLAAAIHVGDFSRVEDLLAGNLDLHLKKDVLLSVGRFDEAREVAIPLRNRTDRALAKRLEGRTVAVVGPAENTLGNGAEIDAHDFVARTNFVANESFLTRSEMLGTRTSAAYYNSIFYGAHEAEIAETMRAGRIEFAMLRSPVERTRIFFKARGQRTRGYDFTPLVYMARGYAMRHVLNDLALMPAARMTAYGSDFFLGETSHFAGYQERTFDRIRSYVVHDPLETWRFMRRLAEAGLMHVDAVLDAILKLDEEGFIAALDRRIGNHQP